LRITTNRFINRDEPVGKSMHPCGTLDPV